MAGAHIPILILRRMAQIRVRDRVRVGIRASMASSIRRWRRWNEQDLGPAEGTSGVREEPHVDTLDMEAMVARRNLPAFLILLEL